MRRTTLDVAIDGNTMMLIRLTQALKLSERSGQYQIGRAHV